MQTTSIPA